jgi:hypothetical protein
LFPLCAHGVYFSVLSFLNAESFCSERIAASI